MPIRHALVTGASAGIGRELVRQLVRDRGITVLATARRLDRLESLAAELPAGKVHVLAGDLADPAFRGRLWEHAEATFPDGIDLVVNNAGLGHYGPFEGQDPESDWRPMLDVNVEALLDLTARALRHMKPRRSGQVVEVSSVLGFVGLPYSAVYVATKHAVNGFVRSLRYELRGTGVRVWAACPGQTESEFFSVASGGTAASGVGPKGEPTERIARNIVRGLDRRAGLIPTSLAARAVVSAAHWLPGPFEWIMGRVTPKMFAKELADAKTARDATPRRAKAVSPCPETRSNRTGG